MKIHKYTIPIIAFLLIFILFLPNKTGFGSKADYLNEVDPIFSSTTDIGTEFTDTIWPMFISPSVEKNSILSKLSSLELKANRDLKKLTKLEPDYKLQQFHTALVDLVASQRFMIQFWEATIENTEVEKIDSPSEMKEKMDIYKRLQGIVNNKMDVLSREMEEARN